MKNKPIYNLFIYFYIRSHAYILVKTSFIRALTHAHAWIYRYMFNYDICFMLLIMRRKGVKKK